ncbi:MAG: hypothetical protein LBI64_08125 [Coriobacteriales bacterium]|jgi:hypothetical protein|nr:hypothetical protein [Coriobacteriales bacterium]
MTLKAYGHYLRSMAASILMFVATVSVFIGLATWGLDVVGELLADMTDLEVSLWQSISSVLMLVLGTIMPLYLETMLGFGLTRRQHAVALLGAAGTISVGLALVSGCAAVVLGLLNASGPTVVGVPELVAIALSDCLCFIAGWFIILGYQLRRVWSACLTTAVGASLFLFLLPWAGGTLLYLNGVAALVTGYVWDATLASTVSFITCLLLALACLVLASVVLLVSRRIAVKL